MSSVNRDGSRSELDFLSTYLVHMPGQHWHYSALCVLRTLVIFNVKISYKYAWGILQIFNMLRKIGIFCGNRVRSDLIDFLHGAGRKSRKYKKTGPGLIFFTTTWTCQKSFRSNPTFIYLFVSLYNWYYLSIDTYHA